MLIEEILYRVKTTLNDTKINNIFSNRFLFDKIITSRAMLLSESIKKKHKISHLNYQVLSSVSLLHDPIYNEYTTVFDLPKPISSYDYDELYKVKLIGVGTIRDVSLVTHKIVEYDIYNKYTKLTPKCYLKDKKLVFFNMPLGNFRIEITGLFEDPTETYKFIYTDKELKVLNFLLQDFPFDESKVDLLLKLIIEESSVWFNNIDNNEKRELS